MKQRLQLSNTTLVISLRCNLRCKLCAVNAPYYKNPPHYSFETLRKSVKKFFEAVDYVDKFTVNGGEPMLHPQLPEIMNFILQYSDKIGMLEIITNGTIVPNESLLKSLRSSDKIDILIDNYGPDLSKGVPAIIRSFEENKIKFRARKYYGHDAHLGGWVDLSDISKKNRTSSETQNIYRNCAYPNAFHCFAIIGDKAYICGVYKWAQANQIISDNTDEYVDFSDDTLSTESIRTKIRQFYERPYFSACEYCNGFCEDSKRFLPAEQL